MAKGSFLKSGALAALAAGIALMASPAMAERGHRDGGWSGEARAEGAAARGGWRAQAPQSAPQAAPQPQYQAPAAQMPARQMPQQVDRPVMRQAQGGWQAPQQTAPSDNGAGWRGRRDGGQGGGGSWGGNQGWRQRSAPADQTASQAPAQAPQGWRQRSAPVEQAPSQTTQGWRSGTDARAEAPARQRGWQGRNGTYSDANRDRTYGGDRRHDDRRDGWNGSRSESRHGGQHYDNNRTGWRGDNHSSWRGNRDRHWDRGWRNDNRYNWSYHRSHNRDRYRMGRYYAPYRGYYYSPISIGFRLDSLFFTSRYWISDPWDYRLPEVYGPYRWVRYYDDVLLVDIYSGEVVDVIRNFFW